MRRIAAERAVDQAETLEEFQKAEEKLFGAIAAENEVKARKEKPQKSTYEILAEEYNEAYYGRPGDLGCGAAEPEALEAVKYVDVEVGERAEECMDRVVTVLGWPWATSASRDG